MRPVVEDRGSRAAEPSGRRGRRTALQLVLILGLLVLAAVAIAGILPGSGGRLADARVGWIVAGVAAELVALIGYTILFHGVFAHRPYRLSATRSAQISLGELGAFAVVPTGAAGPVLRVWALLAEGMPFAVIMVRSVIHGVIFNLPYVVVAGVLGLGVVFGLGPGHAPSLVALAPLAVVLAAGILALSATLLSRSSAGLPPGRWRRRGVEIVQAVPEGLRETPTALRRPLPPLGAVGYWAGDCTVLVLAFHAVHSAPAVGVVVLAYMLGQLGNALPLPGGVGGVEPVMLGVFAASGVALGPAGAAVLLYRFISLGLQAIFGTVAVVTLVPAIERDRGRREAPR